MGEAGHRYTFGPPKGGWPTFPPREREIQNCKECGDTLIYREMSKDPEERICFVCLAFPDASHP